MDRWDMAEIEIERQETADRKQKRGQEHQKRYERRLKARKEKEIYFSILEKMIEEAQDIDKQYDDAFLEKVWGRYIHCGLSSCSKEGVYFQPHLTACMDQADASGLCGFECIFRVHLPAALHHWT
jgi:hypothetical protein